MNLYLVVVLGAVVAAATAIENKRAAFHQSIKDLGDEIRDRKNLEYSYTLPHSHVASFRSLDRRISSFPHNGPARPAGHGAGRYGAGRKSFLPPNAVKMEPMIPYSQKDPLFDASSDGLDLAGNELHAQSKILTVPENNYQDNLFVSRGEHLPPSGPPYGPVVLPYYEHPEPIIEIIIKESNETLPAVPVAAPLVGKPKKEPVQVFYVKYQQNPHGGENDVIYDKPIPAITPPSNSEEDHHESYTTATPLELLTIAPPPSTTLRAIIHPESEHFHSESGIRVTFGGSSSGGSHSHGGSSHSHGDSYGSEGHEESAPHVAVAFPQASPLTQQKLPGPTPSHFQKRQQVTHREQLQAFPTQNFQHTINHKQLNQQPTAQQRIQSQPPAFTQNFQQLPLQNTPNQPFRSGQSQFPRLQNAPLFNGPPQGPHQGPPQGPPQVGHSGPAGSVQNLPPPHFPPFRPTPSFQQRPAPAQSSPPRPPFKQGPQRPFHQGPQPQQFQFNEHQYLQQNYHTITTDQLEPVHSQQPPNNKPIQNFKEPPRSSPGQAPFSISQEEYNKRYNEQVQFFKQKEQQQQQQNFRQRPQVFPTGHQNTQTKFSQPEQPKQQQPPVHHNVQPILNVQNQNHNFNQQQQQQQQYFNVQNTRVQIQPKPAPQQIQAPAPSQIPHDLPGSHFIPPGGEVIASVPKFEQHLLITPAPIVRQQHAQFSQIQQHVQHSQPQQHIQHQQPQQHAQHSQPLPQASPLVQHFSQNGLPLDQIKPQQHFVEKDSSSNIGSDFLTVFEQNQKEILELQEKLRKSEEEQQKLRALTSGIASSTAKPNNYNQQYIASNHNYNNDQYVQIQGRAPQNKPYIAHNTNKPPLIASTRYNSIESSTTPRYVSSTSKSSVEKSEPKEKSSTKRPIEFELPDEVPDDLREQLLSSGILENAQISVLDYDKVGDIPLESLPPEQLANFYGAGGGLQISGSAPVGAVIKRNGDQVRAEIQNDHYDQVDASSEHDYTNTNSKRDVEMKVVHFDPNTAKGQQVAEKYVQDGAKQVEPVALNDHKYNRYLPLKVSGAHFPLPDVPELAGRKVTSVVVLAPVNNDSSNEKDAGRSERAAPSKTKSISFVAGDALKRLVKTPTQENYKKWLEIEKNTTPDLQSVVLLVTGTKDNNGDKEIFMYDVTTQTVSKLSGELSSAFVDVAETNAHSKDFDRITVADAGTVESSVKVLETKITPQKPAPKENKHSNHKPVYSEVDAKKSIPAEKSTNRQRTPDYGSKVEKVETEPAAPKYTGTRKPIADSSSSESKKSANQVLISSGYSRMKMGRSLDAED